MNVWWRLIVGAIAAFAVGWKLGGIPIRAYNTPAYRRVLWTCTIAAGLIGGGLGYWASRWA